jgi:LCP family protein required for cell wall assembly
VITINKNNKKIKKPHIVKNIMALIIIGVFLIIGYTVSRIYSQMSKVEFEQINKEDLAVNSDIFDEVSDTLSKSEFSDVKTVVFFGVDSRETEGEFSGRSDTIMIASINPKNKGISLISIPRDTYVTIPEHGKDKINHAYSYGKEQLAIKTINQNFGLNLTEYVTIDFSGLINVINEIGGIELEITDAEMQYINGRSAEDYAISKNEVKKLTSSGKVRLDGEQALTHSRNRTIGDDFVRASRQRKVLEALITKISSLNPAEILNVSDTVLEEVKTNINIAGYIGSLLNVVSNKNEYLKNMVSAQIPAAEYSEGKTIRGVYYFTTDYIDAKNDFIKNIYGK